jgi:hypothetical protein
MLACASREFRMRLGPAMKKTGDRLLGDVRAISVGDDRELVRL